MKSFILAGVLCLTAVPGIMLASETNLLADHPIADWSRTELSGIAYDKNVKGSASNPYITFRWTESLSSSPLAEQPQLYTTANLEPGNVYLAGFSYNSSALEPSLRIISKRNWSTLAENGVSCG